MSYLKFETYDTVTHNKIIVVPDYQRDYAWGTTDLVTLTEDIRSLYERNLDGSEHTHFLGSIVFIALDESISHAARVVIDNSSKLTGREKLNIIDGQQRLTTISLLFIAIRDYAKAHSLSLGENVMQKLDTGKVDNNGDGIPVLHFSQDNTQKCFNSLVYGSETNYYKRRAGARRLNAAKKHFDEELASLFDDDDNAEAHLNTYLNQVLYLLQLVQIECAEDSDAFQIFESLNATGVPLTPAEQVKSLMLMRSGAKDVSLASWETMVGEVGENNVVEFLAQFMFCRNNQRVSKKDIYRKFKEALAASTVTSMLTELSRLAGIYKQLQIPPSGKPGSEALESLSRLGQRQVYVPLLLSADRFGIESDDFGKIADAVLVFIVRHQVCNQSTNTLDSIFAKACEFIKNEANSADGIIKFFREKQMPDDVFEKMFKDLTFQYTAMPQSKAKVYLKRIEEKDRGADNPLLLKYSDLTVEHIIPKHPSFEVLEGWVGKERAEELRDSDPQLEDFSEQTIMSIGNLALLYRNENSSAGSKNYEAKRTRYTSPMTDEDGADRGIPADVFVLIKNLLNEYPKEFTEECVIERCDTLAEKAKKAWR